MHENVNDDLVQDIVNSINPTEFSTRLKFIALDKTLFEMEISSNGMQQMHDDVLTMISTAVSTASSIIVSAK